MCTSSVSNVIYHKFSHGAAFYTLNGKKVNVMLEFGLVVQAWLTKQWKLLPLSAMDDRMHYHPQPGGLGK